MDFNFYMPARVISGKDAVKQHPEVFSQFGTKCLIITGGSSAEKSGALKDITDVLDSLSHEYTVFNSVTQNPTALQCHLAGQTARDYSVDYIIGIGGGSALDAAKAAAVYAANKSLEPEMIYQGEIMLSPLPLILVGTTAGTGSEVTGVSVLTRENGKKKSVSGKNYYAAISFADPKYTYSVPYNFTVSTAIDAFAHATESYFSNKAEINSHIYALNAALPLFKALKFFYEKHAVPDDAMRDEIYYASLSAGMAINITGTCFPHTLGYTLTEDFGFAHGLACAVFMPEYLRRAMEYKNDVAMEFFSLLGTNLPELVKIVTALAPSDNVSMTAEQISSYCENWGNVKNFINSPGSFTQADANELFTNMFLK